VVSFILVVKLVPDMVKLTEVVHGVKYAKGTDNQKIHADSNELYLVRCSFWGMTSIDMANSSKTLRTTSSKT